jgi:hypothetical protein
MLLLDWMRVGVRDYLADQGKALGGRVPRSAMKTTAKTKVCGSFGIRLWLQDGGVSDALTAQMLHAFATRLYGLSCLGILTVREEWLFYIRGCVRRTALIPSDKLNS